MQGGENRQRVVNGELLPPRWENYLPCEWLNLSSFAARK